MEKDKGVILGQGQFLDLSKISRIDFLSVVFCHHCLKLFSHQKFDSTAYETYRHQQNKEI